MEFAPSWPVRYQKHSCDYLKDIKDRTTMVSEDDSAHILHGQF